MEQYLYNIFNLGSREKLTNELKTKICMMIVVLNASSSRNKEAGKDRLRRPISDLIERHTWIGEYTIEFDDRSVNIKLVALGVTHSLVLELEEGVKWPWI
jgi:hypothetical protein